MNAPINHMKVLTKYPVLNCIIPDDWVRKAISAKFHHGDVGLRNRLTIEINAPGGADFWRPEQLIKGVYSNLKNSTLVWIHLTKLAGYNISRCQVRMQVALQDAKIDYAVAQVAVKNYKPRSRRRKVQFGVVVEMRDACRAILLYRPNLIEERRAARYNRDDPKL